MSHSLGKKQGYVLGAAQYEEEGKGNVRDRDRTYNSSVGTERAGPAGFSPTWGRANTIRRKKGGRSLFCGEGQLA